jgi:hypothetical protein
MSGHGPRDQTGVVSPMDQKTEDALSAVADRLGERYGEHPGGVGAIRELVSAEAGRFAEAKVHAFVPILVERAVRGRLDPTAVPAS